MAIVIGVQKYGHSADLIIQQ